MGLLDFLFGSSPQESDASAATPAPIGPGTTVMTPKPPSPVAAQIKVDPKMSTLFSKASATRTEAKRVSDESDQGLAGRTLNDVLGAIVKVPLHLLGPVPTAGNADELDLARDLASRGDHEGAQKQMDSYYQRLHDSALNDEVLGYPTKTTIADQLHPESAPAQIFRSVVKSIPDLAAQAAVYGVKGLAEKGAAMGLSAVDEGASGIVKLLASKAGEAAALAPTFAGIKSNNPREFAINSAKDFAMLFPTLVGIHGIGVGIQKANEAIQPYLEKGTSAIMDLTNTAENDGIDVTPQRVNDFLNGEQDPDMEQVWQKLPQDSRTILLQSHISENRLLSLKDSANPETLSGEARLAKLTGPQTPGEPVPEAQGESESLPREESTTSPTELSISNGTKMPLADGNVYRAVPKSTFDQYMETGKVSAGNEEGRTFFANDPKYAGALAVDGNDVLIRTPGENLEDVHQDSIVPNSVYTTKPIDMENVEYSTDGGKTWQSSAENPVDTLNKGGPPGSQMRLPMKELDSQNAVRETAKTTGVSENAVSQKAMSQVLRSQNPDAESIYDIGRKTTPLAKKVGIWDRFLATPTRVLEKIGWGDKAEALKNADISYNNDLRDAVDQLKGWIKQYPEGGVGGASDTRIFQFINGVKQDNGTMIHPPLDNPVEQKIAGEMQAEFAKYAKAFGITPDENYVTHIFDRSAQGVEFPEDIERMIRDQTPGSVYNPFLLERKGAQGYSESASRAMEAYAKRATRKLNFDPVLEDMSNSMGKLEASQADYVKNFLERVNMRPDAIEQNLNNSIKNAIGYRLGDRPTLSILGNVRKMYTRALIGLNQLTPIKHVMFQGTNIYSQLGEQGTFSGLTQAISRIASGDVEEYQDAGIFTARNIAEDRTISAVNSIGDNMDKALFYQLDNTLKFLRATAYEGGKAQFLRENPEDAEGAIQAGKDMVDKAVFNFGRINTPMALQNDIVKTILPFQSYTVKQAEFMKDMFGGALQGDKAQIAASIRWVGSATVLLSTVAKALGLDWKDFAPGMKLFDSGVKPPSVKYGGAAGGILGSTPAAQPFFAIKGAVENKPDQYGRTQPGNVLQRIIGSPDVRQEAVNVLPAGNQIRKTLLGLQAINKGQVRSTSGKTRLFSVSNDPLNVIRAILLGKYGTREGRDYIEKLNAGKKNSSGDSSMPNLPDLPDLPDLPNLPNLPNLPDIK